ncbi:MAG: carbon starvation protein A, partial [Spirochaetaceae bacterium]|nr:carbon starvation protein A [Spirochaetaceae bacterium]
MISFLLGIFGLLLGFLIYSKIAERCFVVKPEAQTPAYRLTDGVDYVPMSKWKCLLLHLINIAGTGPIFGAIAGALFGPAAFVWIVLGCIFAGSVHDFSVGMLSLKNDGCSIATIVGKFLGKKPLQIMRVFSL